MRWCASVRGCYTYGKGIAQAASLAPGQTLDCELASSTAARPAQQPPGDHDQQDGGNAGGTMFNAAPLDPAAWQ